MTSTIPSLGRLTPVDLREVWPSEPGSFTPWLSQPDNLQFLAEALGVAGLELVATEQSVGIFSADIVARVVDTGEKVLIENQLERSDHLHLGQILTYAAGVDAAIIVWVARQFTEPHRAALDWLNRITSERFAFFGIELGAVKIGNSIPAPNIEVVVRPNDWARVVKAQTEATPDMLAAARFWDGYDKFARDIGAPIRIGASQVRSSNYYVRLGSAGKMYLTAYRAASSSMVGAYVAIFGDNSRTVFERLRENRAAIESVFGGPLEWSEKKEDTVYWILAGALKTRPGEEDWARQQEWLAATMKRLRDSVEPVLLRVQSAA